ncbi:protein-export chaperone SecB [Sutterella sp.]|uniref:protein-export chaperone SecB n=1 Tax=Sutterella sp. TaxID=1981025 RepID=UPI0025D9B507|nr:protein-export chaperone SecB [uncultured Sutterella sp.]
MAENENVQGAEAAQQPQDQQPAQDDQPVFQLQRCYLKDASLEMPHAPEILMEAQEAAPQVDIQFEVSQRLIQTDLYDVTVRGTITVKTPSDKVIILVEGRQSGIFAIHGIPAEPLQHVTNVLCPSMVYPYLRANLADLMTRANVPPVHLPEVNFEVLYQQRLAQAQAEAQQNPQAAN